MVHAQVIALLLTLGRAQDWCAPSAIVADAKNIFIGCAKGKRIEVFDRNRRELVRRIPMPGPVSGLAFTPQLTATCAGPNSTVVLVEDGVTIGAGHTSVAPVSDGRTLYVANQFNNDIGVIDLATRKQVARISSGREPISLALTDKQLWVANALPAMRADRPPVAAEIAVIDTTTRQVVQRIPLPNGSTGLRQLRVSPDGRTVAITHLLSRYFVPTTQADRGWIQTNAFSLIDVGSQKRTATVLLDDVDHGAANPWAVEWTPDGKQLCITHAGTHELSIIDVAALRAKLLAGGNDPANDISFLHGARRRILLAARGPRALTIASGKAWVAGYFSDSLEAVDLQTGTVECIRPAKSYGGGEALFNDGSISFQGWMSCASCHGPDARVDGLNWDLLNDGIGDPINTKSLLLAHRTPPSMSHFVRENAEAAVRAGIEHILFAQRPEPEAAAIDAYLKSLEPLPSPYLDAGTLSAAAERGKKLFFNRRTGCGSCHPSGLFTTLKAYDVGTGKLDTPTLVEIWRTAPYMHDGSAFTLRDVLTTANPHDRHGKTSHLTSAQIDDLVAYLLSL